MRIQLSPNLARNQSSLLNLGILSMLLLLAYMSYVGAISSFFDQTMYTQIDPVSQAYLKTTGHHAKETLVILSEIKAALALLQSSSGGISFILDVQVQLGQILDVIVELIDLAWSITLASVAAVKVWH